MSKNSITYGCSACGWQCAKWAGRCAECQRWGTIVEQSSGAGNRSETLRGVAPKISARAITELASESACHSACGIGEFDRVLGGGLVPGAAVLFSGEPGVGKSTLLLDVAARVAERGERVLYVSGEESAGQVRLRAERTGALHEQLFLANENDLALVLGHIESVQPQLVMVDSVQTLASSQITGIAGGPAQLREVTSVLIREAKTRSTPIVLVGHVTKDGSVAGPRLLEHLVDVVCHFEGDKRSPLRFLRSLKNRFGPSDEVGCFELTGEGITEVPDPSLLFLSRAAAPVSGSCVTVAMEGRRALPVEVQALVASGAPANPRRVTSGVDSARVAMILAVLERRAGVRLHDKDVYVSTVGGVRLFEPAADLAIMLAIASAACDLPLPHDLAAIGELSLAGEIRTVVGGVQREREARRLGYRNILDSTAGTVSNARQLVLPQPPQSHQIRREEPVCVSG